MYIGVAFRLRIIVEAPVVAPYLISETRAFVLYSCSVGFLCPILGSYETQLLCRTVVRLILKQFDYLIDIGPEGGDRGGTVIAEGTPEEVAGMPQSYTGAYVKKYLEK